MKYVVLIFVVTLLHSAPAEIDNNKLLQIFADVREDDIISESCQQALSLLVENLTNFDDPWPLRMLDSTSKIPVGLISLNFGEMGQFSECIRTESLNGLIHGKYCIGMFPLDMTASSSASTAENNLVLRKRAYNIRVASRTIVELADTSDTDNMSSTLQMGISWAICIPSSCSDEDGEAILNQIGLESVNCQTKETSKVPLTNGAIAAIVVLSFFAFVIATSTALDLYYRYSNLEPPHVILIAFSVYTNGEKLFRINKNSNELTCLNGIRLFSMMWVIIGHVLSMYITAPLVNFMDVMEYLDDLRSMTIYSGVLAVDTFFLLSGLLVVYSYFKAKHNGVKFNIFQFYIHRYLRLTPALAAGILFTACLIRYVGTGPKWNSVNVLETGCQKYWWSTLLYVQNYVNGDTNYCLPHSWYLSIDMQLYIISPLILIPLWKYPKIGLCLIGGGIVTFIIVPFCVGYITEIPAFMTDFQAHVSLLDFVNLYYMKTHTRAAPYFIGLLLGYLLAKIKFLDEVKPRKWNRFLVIFLWLVCAVVGLTCVYGGHDTLRGKEYDKLATSFYLALMRPSWALCVGWVVYACVNGYGGPINWFLSLPIYQVLNRFTYSVYLIHYMLIYSYGYMFKIGAYFDEFTVVYTFWGTAMISFAFATVWVLAFESPIVVIEKLIFGGPAKKKVEHNDNTNGLSA